MAAAVAIADVAVEMGPRNRRRLTRGAIALLVIAAVAVAVSLLTRSANQAPFTSVGSFAVGHAGSKGDQRYLENQGQLIFGMTPQGVRALVGSPTKTHGNCWEYREDEVLHDHGVTRTYSAESICFAFGKYATRHLQMNGQWYDDNGNAIQEPSN